MSFFILDLIVDQATALNALPTVSNGTANKAVCPSLPVGVDDAHRQNAEDDQIYFSSLPLSIASICNAMKREYIRDIENAPPVNQRPGCPVLVHMFRNSW